MTHRNVFAGVTCALVLLGCATTAPSNPATVVARDHTITAGLKDFRIDDELYAKLVGEDPIHVLVQADSDWSGRTEPMAWTRKYGEGKVFVLPLGHDTKAREAEGFKTLLRRGTKWAAR